jgi:PAS domain S-box-containing protein
MIDKRQALSSPLFESLARIAFSSVMVTRASDESGASEIVYVNERFTDLTGYSADDVMGKTPGLLQGPKTDREVLKRLESDLVEDRVFYGRTINYRKDGSEFEIEWKVARVIDLDGVTYYIAVQQEAG